MQRCENCRRPGGRLLALPDLLGRLLSQSLQAARKSGLRNPEGLAGEAQAVEQSGIDEMLDLLSGHVEAGGGLSGCVEGFGHGTRNLRMDGNTSSSGTSNKPWRPTKGTGKMQRVVASVIQA